MKKPIYIIRDVSERIFRWADNRIIKADLLLEKQLTRAWMEHRNNTSRVFGDAVNNINYQNKVSSWFNEWMNSKGAIKPPKLDRYGGFYR